MNKYLLIGAAGFGAYFLYSHFMKGQVQAPASLTPYSVAPNLMGQPSQTFPFNSQTPVVRQDNSNQPWYQANRNFIAPTTAAAQAGFDTNFLQNVQYVQGVSEIGKSVASLWSDLSDLFSSNDSPNTAVSSVKTAGDAGGIDWSQWGLA